MHAGVRYSGRHRETEPGGKEAGSVDRQLTLWVCAASAALFLALAWPMLSGRIYGGDDLTAFHLPMRWFYWKALRNGDAFDWLPDILCGFYLTGEGQVGTYHPLHLFLYRWAPFATAFNLEVWLSYPMMFAGTALLLSRSAFGEVCGDANETPGAAVHHRPPGLPLHAALFGAMLFTFSSSCMLHFMHMNSIAVFAHLPWLLWAIDVAVRSKREHERVLAFAAVSLLTGSELLCGHPQSVWICFVAELSWLWLALATRGDAEEDSGSLPGVWQTLFRFGLAKFLGGMIGAIQLFPTVDHLFHSQRLEAAAGVASQGSLHPLNIVQFLAPYLLQARVKGFITHEYGLYAGAIPLVLCVWLFSQRAAFGRARRPLLGVALFGAMALVLSLGGYGGVYRLLSLLPGIGEFRLPARYLVLVHLAIAILASAAVARLPSDAKVAGQVAWPDGWKLTAFSAALALELRLLLPSQQLGSVLGAAIGPALFVVAMAVFTLHFRGSRVALPLLIVLAAADVGFYGLSYVVWPGSRTWESVLASVPVPVSNTARLATMQPDDHGKFAGNQWILRGWRLSDGYVGLLPSTRLDGHSLAGLRMANVGLVLRRDGQPLVEGLGPVDARMDAVPDPLPRLRTATSAIVSTSWAGDEAFLSAASLEGSPAAETLATTALVDTPMSVEGPAGEATLLSDRPGALAIEVQAPAGQLLVIADRYHRGWRALVDDVSVDVHRVNGDFMGVLVKAGVSTVRLTFDPDSLRYGKGVSLAGLAAWALLLTAATLRARREGGPRTAAERADAEARRA